MPTSSSASSTSCPIKSAGQKAPPQKTVSVVIDKFFPVVPTTEVVFKEFNIPIDFSGIKVPAQPVTTTQAIVTTTTVVSIPIGLLVSTTSGPSTATSVTGPSTATISTSTSTSTSTPTTVTTVLGTVVSSVPYKRFNCQKCSYKTDRRQDFEKHQRIHEGVKIKCGHRGCKKSFWTLKVQKSSLQNSSYESKKSKMPPPGLWLWNKWLWVFDCTFVLWAWGRCGAKMPQTWMSKQDIFQLQSLPETHWVISSSKGWAMSHMFEVVQRGGQSWQTY